MIKPSSTPYLTLAEIGYFGQLLLTLVGAVWFLTTSYSNSTPLALATATLYVCVSSTWLRLGKDAAISRFVGAGALGVAFGVFSWVSAFANPSLPAVFQIGLSGVSGFIFLAYIVYQIRAFFTAAEVLEVRLFRFAALILIAGIAATVFSAVALGAFAVAYGLGSRISNFVPIQIWVGDVWIGALSLVAGMGFHRLKGVVRLKAAQANHPPSDTG